MVLLVDMVPKPPVIEPAARAPVWVMFPCTAVGRVWLKEGTLLPLVTNTLLAAAAVTCSAPVPLPNRMPLLVKLPVPVPPRLTDNWPAQLSVKVLLAMLPWTLVSLTTLVGAAELMMLPDWVRPVPATALLVIVQAVPFHSSKAPVPAWMVAPCMSKLTVPMLFIRIRRAAAVLVGLGRLRVWPAVVWLMLKLVPTSTVAGAVPIGPPVGKSPRAMAVYRVLPLLVKLLPVPTVRPPLAVTRPLKVGLLTTVSELQVPPVPKVMVLPVPARLPVPLGQTSVVLPWTAVLALLP